MAILEEIENWYEDTEFGDRKYNDEEDDDIDCYSSDCDY